MTTTSRYRALLQQLTGKPTDPLPSRLRRLFLAFSSGVLGALAVLEGLNAPALVMAAATGLSGVLCVGVLAAPEGRRLGQWTALAAAASLLVTAVEANLAHGPENTPGMAELTVLLLLTARTVRRGPPLKAVSLALLPALAAVVLPMRIDHWSTDPYVPLFIGALAVCALPCAVALGAGLRLRDALRAREHEHIRQEQRLEHARQLHDFVAHHVTAIVAQAQAARFTATTGQEQSPDELDHMLSRIEEAGAQALDSMRTTVTLLRSPATTRPPATPDTTPTLTTGLGQLHSLAEEFSALGPPVTLRLDPRLAGSALPPGTTATVQHIVRESLTNVRKHAHGARHVDVDITQHPTDPALFDVTVHNNGPTDATNSQTDATDATDHKHTTPPDAPTQGFGLTGLTERTHAHGGTLTTGPTPTGGWHVHATLPHHPAHTSTGTGETGTTGTADTAETR